MDQSPINTFTRKLGSSTSLFFSRMKTAPAEGKGPKSSQSLFFSNSSSCDSLADIDFCCDREPARSTVRASEFPPTLPPLPIFLTTPPSPTISAFRDDDDLDATPKSSKRHTYTSSSFSSSTRQTLRPSTTFNVFPPPASSSREQKPPRIAPRSSSLKQMPNSSTSPSLPRVGEKMNKKVRIARDRVPVIPKRKDSLVQNPQLPLHSPQPNLDTHKPSPRRNRYRYPPPRYPAPTIPLPLPPIPNRLSPHFQPLNRSPNPIRSSPIHPPPVSPPRSSSRPSQPTNASVLAAIYSARVPPTAPSPLPLSPTNPIDLLTPPPTPDSCQQSADLPDAAQEVDELITFPRRARNLEKLEAHLIEKGMPERRSRQVWECLASRD